MSEHEKAEEVVTKVDSLAIGDVVDVTLHTTGESDPVDRVRDFGVVVSVSLPLGDAGGVYAHVTGPLGFETSHFGTVKTWAKWYPASECEVVYRGTSALRMARDLRQAVETRDLLAHNLEQLASESARTETELRAELAQIKTRIVGPIPTTGTALISAPPDEALRSRLALAEELNARQLDKLQRLDLELSSLRAQLVKKS